MEEFYIVKQTIDNAKEAIYIPHQAIHASQATRIPFENKLRTQACYNHELGDRQGPTIVYDSPNRSLEGISPRNNS